MLLLLCEKFKFVSFALGIYFGLEVFRAGCEEENPSNVGVAPRTPPTPWLDARRAATTRRFGALGRAAQGRAADPSPYPSRGLPRFRKLGAGRVLPHPSRYPLEYRKTGEGKLSTSFPSPLDKAHGIAPEMRRTAKEVGGGGGRNLRRLRWFLPPQNR